jgi:hypothetical protein
LRNRAVSATPTEVLAARTPRPTFGGGSSGSRRTCRTARDGRSGGARLDLRMPAAVPRRRAPRRGAVLAPHRAFRLQPPRPPGGGALRPLRPSAHRLLAVKTVAILRECSCACGPCTSPASAEPAVSMVMRAAQAAFEATTFARSRRSSTRRTATSWLPSWVRVVQSQNAYPLVRVRREALRQAQPFAASSDRRACGLCRSNLSDDGAAG